MDLFHQSFQGLFLFLTIVGLAVFLLHWASRRGGGGLNFVSGMSTDEMWSFLTGVVFNPVVYVIAGAVISVIILVLWLVG